MKTAKDNNVSGYTRGEWLFAEHMGDTIITAPDNTKYNRRIPICEVIINPQKPQEGLANCKLIASAPTLKAENEKLKAGIASMEDINLNDVVYYFHFCRWLDDNGWENYVDPEIWINTSEGNKTRNIKVLFEEFSKEFITE